MLVWVFLILSENAIKSSEIPVKTFLFSELLTVFDRLEELFFSHDISTFVEQESVENVRAPQSVDTIQDMLWNFLIAFFLPSTQGRRKMFLRDVCNTDAIFNLTTRYCRLAHLLQEYGYIISFKS